MPCDLRRTRTNRFFSPAASNSEKCAVDQVLIQRTASVPVGDLLALPHTAARGLIQCMHIVQGGVKICEL